MADNITALANTGSGTDVLATDEISGVHYPLVKIALGSLDSDDGPVNFFNPLPVTGDVGISGTVAITNSSGGSVVQTVPSGSPMNFAPGYGGHPTGYYDTATVDPEKHMMVRGQILTDEGTFRCNFANSSYALDIDAVTNNVFDFSGSALLIAGTADLHNGDYVKISGDADTAWIQVTDISSTTGSVTFGGSYSGASGSGTMQRSIMKPVIGSGGSITVGSGQATIASGTTNSSVTGFIRAVDYGPLVFRSRFSISQRIANQTLRAGLEQDATTVQWFARFSFTGTTNTSIVCETGRNPSGAPSASEKESTTVTLPNGLTTASLAEYRVELLTEFVRFYVDNVLVAEHSQVIPAQHDDMAATVKVINGTGAASTTSMVVDYVTCKNHNKLEVGIMSQAENIVANQTPLVPFSYSQAGVIAINTTLMTIDCLQYKSLMIHCTSMGTTGVVTVQWSNSADFTGATTATLFSETGATSTTFNAAVLRGTHVMARYCRLRLTTATTGGTTTIVVQGSQQAIGPASQQVQGSVTVSGSLTSGGTVTNTPVTPTQSFINSAATTNATSVKASAGTVWNIVCYNANAAVRYVKFYNLAVAPTVGTSTPVFVIAVPATGTAQISPGSNGIRFGTGIALAITTGAGDADATAVAANEIKVATAYT